VVFLYKFPDPPDRSLLQDIAVLLDAPFCLSYDIKKPHGSSVRAVTTVPTPTYNTIPLADVRQVGSLDPNSNRIFPFQCDFILIKQSSKAHRHFISPCDSLMSPATRRLVFSDLVDNELIFSGKSKLYPPLSQCRLHQLPDLGLWKPCGHTLLRTMLHLLGKLQAGIAFLSSLLSSNHNDSHGGTFG
jgi:hypothetical protein